MIDISTTYMGLKLKSPLIASSSPLLKKVEHVKQLEEGGVAAVILYSLFEEQITHESLELHHHLSKAADLSPEAMSYLPDNGTYSLLPDKYLENIQKLKKAVQIPVIGSLNGVSRGGWIRYAQLIEDAGADALELNLYYIPTDPDLTAQDVEDAQVQLVSDVRASITIPLAVKLSPYYTALPHFVQQLAKAGANGLVLFNRFYQPDFDIEELEIAHTLDLSTSTELRVPLRWISILQSQVHADFALTSGVHNAQDVLKAMMAGAKVAMMASELLQNGVGRVAETLRDLVTWMEEHEYESIVQMQGSMSQKSVAQPGAFERANYMRVLNSFGNLP